MEIKGTIIYVGELQTFGSFQKREFWIKEDKEKYPQTFKVECVQDKVTLLDSVGNNENVTAHVNLRGRHYDKNGKEGVINSIQCWKLDKEVPF